MVRLSTGDMHRMMALEGGILQGFPALLENAKATYEAGDKSELWDLVCLCALYQVIVPDWAVNALYEIREGLRVGAIADLNDAFGEVVQGSPKERHRQAYLRGIAAEVTILLQVDRSGGGSRTAPDLYDRVIEVMSDRRSKGEETSRVPTRREVEQIDKSMGGKEAALAIKQGSNAAVGGIMDVTLPPIKRTGRPLIWDTSEPNGTGTSSYGAEALEITKFQKFVFESKP